MSLSTASESNSPIGICVPSNGNLPLFTASFLPWPSPRSRVSSSVMTEGFQGECRGRRKENNRSTASRPEPTASRTGCYAFACHQDHLWALAFLSPEPSFPRADRTSTGSVHFPPCKSRSVQRERLNLPRPSYFVDSLKPKPTSHTDAQTTLKGKGAGDCATGSGAPGAASPGNKLRWATLTHSI